MSDPLSEPQGSGPAGPVIRDRRRLDPETGQLRDAYGSTEPPTPADQSTDQPSDQPADQTEKSARAGQSRHAAEPIEPEQVIDPIGPDGQVETGTADISLDGILADLDKAQSAAAERLSDLQRLQAEFVN